MLEELEKLCAELEVVDTQTQQKMKQISDLEEKAKQLNEDVELKRMIAELRGEETPAPQDLEELEQAKNEFEKLKIKSEELKKQALKGMAELDLPVSTRPQIDNEGKFITTLEGGPYERSVKFIAHKLDSSVPLDIDGVLFDSNKIIVTEVSDMRIGLQKLLVFKQNIRRMAMMALGEKNPEIEKIIDYMHQSTYKDIWEAAGSKQRVVFENLYKELAITESSEKKRVQNFFTNSQKVLGDAFPFRNIGSGIWERTFFGSLVWMRYTTLYPFIKEGEKVSKEVGGMSEGEVSVSTKPKIESLNKYMEKKELDKILYGNKGE